MPAAPRTASLEDRGIYIEYPPVWAPLVRQFHPWLYERLAKLADWRPEDDLIKLHRNRDKVAAYAAKQLGVPGQPRAMMAYMTQMERLVGKACSAIPNPRRIRLWRRSQLIAYLAAGGQLEGYLYDGKRNVVSFIGQFAEGGGADTKQPGLVPIVLRQTAGPPLLAEAKKRTDRFLSGVRRVVPRLIASAVNSSIRVGIRRDLRVQAPHDAWLVAGAADYLTCAALRRYVSGDIASQYLRVLDVRSYPGLRNRVKLAAWSMKPDEVAMPADRLGMAREAFAMAEVMRLLDRHGEDTLAKVFAELRKTGNTTSPTAVVDAVKKVTGEDVTSRLAR